MNIKRTFTSLTTSAIIFALAVVPAFGAVNFDSTTGTGFVGKGDVQNVMNWDNATLKSNADKLSFSYSKPGTQAVSQNLTQTALQTASENILEELSCTINDQLEVSYRQGSRNGTRTASRNGTRDGSRSGTVDGLFSSNVVYETRAQNQVNGFILTGFGNETTMTHASYTWNEASWGNATFSDYSWADVIWGDWQSDMGNDPTDCLNSSGVTNRYHSISYGGTVEGDITYTDIQYGNETYGAVTTSGSSMLYVNGIAL